MQTADFIIPPELEFFLPQASRGRTLHLSFDDHQSTKHLIESLGIPHVEVGLVTRNDAPVDLSYLPRTGDLLRVFPAGSGCPIEPRFALDSHLGRLAAYLRMLGFDAVYRNHIQDAELAEISLTDRRILLTRDRRLLMRKTLVHGYCLRSLEPQDQLSEVIRRFDLAGRVTPFRRCLRCNGPLVPVLKKDILDRLLPLTVEYYDEFALCPSCNQVYWKGSHYEHMTALIARSLR